MAAYNFLVVAFYTFLGLFLETELLKLQSLQYLLLWQFPLCSCLLGALPLIQLIRPGLERKRARSDWFSNLNYGFLLSQITMRFFRRMKRKILKTFLRRKYLDPLKCHAQMEPLLPFPFVMKDDAFPTDPKKK